MTGVSLLISLILGIQILNIHSLQCNDDEFWNGQGCINCQDGCSCSSYMGCTQILQCSSDEIYDQSTGECVDCPKGCSVCTIQGTYGFNCSSCLDGYQLIQNICIELNNIAVFYPPSQQRWQQYNNQAYILPHDEADEASCVALSNITGLCIQCIQGSFMNEFGFCEYCVNNCQTCISRGTCQQCNTSYYWSQQSQNVGCMQCPDEADESGVAGCSSTGYVTSCQPGYELIYGTLQSTCIKCDTGCLNCTNGLCTSCDEGFYLSSGSCLSCIGNVYPSLQSCSVCSNSTVCTTCSTGYQLVGNQCKNCSSTITNCLSCTALNGALTCSQCKSGYYLNSVGQCLPCSNQDQNSMTCTMINTTISITKCDYNYLLVNNTCVLNTNQCYLMANSTGKCSQCYPGYILINGTCESCPSSCMNCIQSNGQPSCSLCNTGYYLNTINNVSQCASCSYGCSSCNDSNSCNTCEDEFYMSSAKCLSCGSGCQTCNSQGCQTCSTGYFSYTTNNVQECYPCPYGCDNCQTSNGQTCTTCSSGFYQKGSGCYQGSASCAIHDSQGTCITCQYGFRLSSGMCLPCVQVNYGFVCGENAACSS